MPVMQQCTVDLNTQRGDDSKVIGLSSLQKPSTYPILQHSTSEPSDPCLRNGTLVTREAPSSTRAAWRLWSPQHSVSQAELVPRTKSSPVAMWSRLAVCACLVGSVAAMCPDDPEVDLCEVDEQETSHSTRNGAWMALLLPLASTRPSLATGLALALAAGSVGVDAVTCGELKTFYKNEQCCGQPTQEVSAPVPGTAACPYSFAKPACSTAEPQTPRDLTAGAVGSMTPKAATLTDDQANFLPLVNVHFHLGAEHKTEAGPCSLKSSAEELSHEFGARH